MDYKEAGVDVDRGDAWIGIIKRLIANRASLPKVGIGGFSGIMPIGGGRSIIACCDGVGTKVELAAKTGIYRGLGQDLVAMSVNDLVTCGAEPLFFLDYIACGALDEPKMESVVEGILDGCEQSECALLGGETAEMPGVYAKDGFDLAGFAVGLANENNLIDGSGIGPGDAIIGLASSGIHSNGYSLVRKILSGRPGAINDKPSWGEGSTIGEILMRPTKIYVRSTLKTAKTGLVKGMAHITGGGLESNINRAVPAGLKCELDYNSWKRPAIFDFISDSGVEEPEMRRVFNLGVGYAFITSSGSLDAVMEALRSTGESPAPVGRIVET
jgi:phosphoribosylformylglycinamidine cyclo-ligase